MLYAKYIYFRIINISPDRMYISVFIFFFQYTHFSLVIYSLRINVAYGNYI